MAQRHSDSHKVSVIITTRNSAATLGRLLRSARTQTHAAHELIVVDNGSSDGSRDLACRHADLVIDAGPERSAQRNRGAAAASGDFLLIVDSDMILMPSVLESCVHTAEAEGAVAVVVPEATVGSGFLSRVRALERACYEGDATIEAARFFSADAYRRHGGYEETLTGPEDWDLPSRMLRAGARVGRANNTQILHDETGLRLGSHLRKKYYYGKSFGEYIRRNPSRAARQLTPLRPAFFRHRRRLARHPVLTTAMVCLKVAEFCSGAAGLVWAATLRSRPRLRRHR